MKTCIEISTLARCADPGPWPTLPLTSCAVAYSPGILERDIRARFPNDIGLDKLAAYYCDASWVKCQNHDIWDAALSEEHKLCEYCYAIRLT